MPVWSRKIINMVSKIKQRQEKIVEYVRNKERVSVEELASLLGISRETIRRDLTDLANVDKIKKIHGGATLPPSYGEGSFQQRMSENVDAKVKIAQAALKLFSNGETIFIDTGSTTLYLAERLWELSGLTIITNSTAISKVTCNSSTENKVFLLGGEFNADNQQTIGTMVTAQIRSFRAHHCVLTVGALDKRSGAMDYNIEEAQVARAMIEQSQSITVLLDSSKFNQLASFEVCSLAAIDRLICDKTPPKPLLEALNKANILVIIA